jgi:adenosylcobinamide kinase/adenosylcobinamide-phosphate guanylyltransferase
MALPSSLRADTCLVLGGARSGKSHYAETLAHEAGKEVVYIATAKVLDAGIQQRVNQHISSRPSEWQTVEEPIALADSLLKWASPQRVILVDCLTMWLTNLMAENNESRMNQELEQLLECISKLTGMIVFVSNEVSMGVVPMGEMTRQFVDEAGRLHQQLAQQVDQVVLVVAGLPHILKSKLMPPKACKH